MPIYRPDPRAYLGLRQAPPGPTPRPKIPDWQMGDDVPIDEGLPLPPTQGQQEADGNYVPENKAQNPAIKTRITKKGKRVYHQRYYDLWQNGQHVGDVLVDPEPWLAEEPEPEPVPEDPRKDVPAPLGFPTTANWQDMPLETKRAWYGWSENQLTNMSKKPDFDAGPDNEWKAVEGRWTQVEKKREDAIDPSGVIPPLMGLSREWWNDPMTPVEDKQRVLDWYESQITDLTQEPTGITLPKGYHLEVDPSRGRWEAVKDTVEKEQDQTGTSLDERVEYSPDKAQQRTYVTSRDKAGKVTRQYTSEWTAAPKEPKEPVSESEQAQTAVLKAREARIAQAWSLNPRNPEVAGRMSAYLRGNPMPQARILPDNGLDYGPQGGYTPSGLPPSQILAGMLRAGGIGSKPQSYTDVAIGQNGEKTRVFEGTPQYNQALAAGARPTAGSAPDSFVSELPWNEQQLSEFLNDPAKVAEYEAKGSQYGADWQRVDPETGEISSTGEMQKYLRGDVAYKAQAAKEQQDEQLSKDPNYMAGLVAAAQARVSPYLREQESQKRSRIVSELRGTGVYKRDRIRY